MNNMLSILIILMLIVASWVLLDTTDDILHNPGGGSDTLFKGVAFIFAIGFFGAFATLL